MLSKLVLKYVTCCVLAAVTLAQLHAIDVEVDRVIEPPEGIKSMHRSGLEYVLDGTLLLFSGLTFNLYVLEDDGWKPLIEHFQYPSTEGALFPNDQAFSYNVSLSNSIIDYEYLYRIQHRGDESKSEYYRVHLDGDGEVVASLVDQRYFDSHRMLPTPYEFDPDFTLLCGHELFYPDPPPDQTFRYQLGTRDSNGDIAYPFMIEFPKAFFVRGNAAVIHPQKHEIAMALSFLRDEWFPWERIITDDLIVLFRISCNE